MIPPGIPVPEQLRAGDEFTVAVVQPQLAAGTLIFLVLTGVISGAPGRIFVGGSLVGTAFTPSVTVDGTGSATLSATSPTTSTWPVGRYQWVAFSKDTSGNRTELAQGVIEIEPDPAGTTVPDPRTRNRRILDNLYALMEGKSLDDVAMYKVGGRELTKLTPTDVMKWTGVYEARVRNERQRRGERVPSKTKGVSFGGRP